MTSRRRITRPVRTSLGVAVAGGVVLVSPWLAAVTCGGGRPEIQGCDDPITDFSGVTDVLIVDARPVRGFQGGSHFQFQIAATGTGLRGCVAQESVLIAPDDGVLSTVTTAVRADVDGTSVVTTPVYHFDGVGIGSGLLRVQTLGRTLEMNVSLDPFAEADAASEGPDASSTTDAR